MQCHLLACEFSLTKEKVDEIMTEARIMRKLSHENVTRSYGVAAEAEPLFIVMEVGSGLSPLPSRAV